ncbi:MAG: polymer-forming cytoskeletal protein [Cyclobacteriaceae bacterium]|nr:polymer-forming cytoskeletal protein [Cyclobacteriaceae bacterium]MCK5209147.1 polymer-forming cytoskeletal protein [Cyclobacteriaceae bacterium]MCK5281427.1 polymer-forming cytoskeletal protein [Cyclobacteriaceae bacterium]MCK5369579.1 polymer-forming cytoskeletal protein [Cyclobacteriaceae bacterium]MCK5467894.1 polymer-forming cytoskeletal protein [Cyclobacteriaceae bacterium]
MFKNKQENMAAQDPSNSSNIIGKGTIVEGNIETFGNIRIEGKVIGSVKSKSKIALGQSSFVEGNIAAQNAEISGEVKGVVEVSDQLILRPSSIIDGDIIANKLIVESGSTFNGGCKMGVAQKEIKIGINGLSKPFEEKKPTTPESKSN